MSPIDFDEHDEASEKRGVDLYKELVRIYATAEVEDYFKDGRWQDDLMRQDLFTVRMHKREAGAPDPPALEDVKLPADLPVERAGAPTMMARPGIPGAAMMGVRPVMAGMVGAGNVAATTPAATTAATPQAGGAVAELRLIALFVAKWKLDPTKTKTMLAKCTPQRRRYVIQNFKAAVAGAEATPELETYISECEESGKWDQASGPMAALAAAQAARTVPAAAVGPKATGAAAGVVPGVVAGVGVKRPIAAVGGPLAQQGAAKAAAGFQPGAAAAGGLRPAVVRPGMPAMKPGVPQVRPVVGGARPAGIAPKAKAGGVISGLLNRF